MEKFVSFVARVRYIEIFSSRGRKIWFVKARVRYIGGSLYGGVYEGFLTLFWMGFFMYAKRMAGGKNYPPRPPPTLTFEPKVLQS